MENLTPDTEIDVKPKKKRGRPKKVKINDTLDEIVKEAEEQKEIKEVKIEINPDRIYTTGEVKKVLNCLFTKREYFNEVLELSNKYVY